MSTLCTTSMESGTQQQEPTTRRATEPAAAQTAQSDCALSRLETELVEQVTELRQQLDQFHSALTAHGGTPATAPREYEQVAELTRQRDELLARVAAAEAAGPAAEEAKASNEKMYELQRRFEMAVEDMRAYKHRVAELEEQLAARPEETEKRSADGPLDWAAQKAKMLASLATDMGGDDQKDDRLTVEGAVRITDDVVAAKEREIAQLKRQLEDLRAERITATAHDAEVADMLDHDALITSERERLRKLQESLLEKQRNAEVELAVERAKLARQRTETEDRMHALKSDLARRQEAGAGSASGSPAPAAQVKATRGRWLARLGLKDE